MSRTNRLECESGQILINGAYCHEDGARVMIDLQPMFISNHPALLHPSSVFYS